MLKNRFFCASYEKGSVLLIALLLTAVIAVISSEILIRGRLEIKQTEQMGLNDRIYLDLQGYQYWAILTLLSYPEEEAFIPAFFKPVTFEKGAKIAGTWQDQQALFNLNSLTRPGKSGFSDLLMSVAPDVKQQQAAEIVVAIKAYLEQVGMMVSPSELRNVKGVSQALYRSIEKYITALPTNENKINVNSVDLRDPAVLLTISSSTQLISQKSLNGFRTCRVKYPGLITTAKFSQFVGCLIEQDPTFPFQGLTYYSRYYLAVGQVKIQKQQHFLYTFLEKARNDQGKPFVRLRWQSLDVK